MVEVLKPRYRRVETRLMNEWFWIKHRNVQPWKRVRVGKVPPGFDVKMVGQIRRWADAIFEENETIYIVEAKMAPDPGTISQLEYYGKLFPQTPEFARFKNHPIVMIFLTSRMDEELKKFAQERGIIYELYEPQWAKDYWLNKLQQ